MVAHKKVIMYRKCRKNNNVTFAKFHVYNFWQLYFLRLIVLISILSLIFYLFIHFNINSETSVQVSLQFSSYVFSYMAWYNTLDRLIAEALKGREGRKAVVRRGGRERREKTGSKVKKGEPRKNNRSEWPWPPMFLSVKLLCVFERVSVFSSVTLSCQLLEGLTLDKAQVLLKIEQLSRQREQYCNFLVFSLSPSLICSLVFSLPFLSLSLLNTHTPSHRVTNGKNDVRVLVLSFYAILLL